jgi:Flp pilus assembly protein TadD
MATALDLHAAGVLRHQQGHTEEALELIGRAIASDGGSASRYNDLGNILAQVDRLA